MLVDRPESPTRQTRHHRPHLPSLSFGGWRINPKQARLCAVSVDLPGLSIAISSVQCAGVLVHFARPSQTPDLHQRERRLQRSRTPEPKGLNSTGRTRRNRQRKKSPGFPPAFLLADSFCILAAAPFPCSPAAARLAALRQALSNGSAEAPQGASATPFVSYEMPAADRRSRPANSHRQQPPPTAHHPPPTTTNQPSPTPSNPATSCALAHDCSYLLITCAAQASLNGRFSRRRAVSETANQA